MLSFDFLLRAFRASIDRPLSKNVQTFWQERQLTLWLAALFTGFTAAYAIILFRLGIDLVQFLWLGEEWSERTATLAANAPWWLVILGPASAGLVVGIVLQTLMPGQRTQGVADVIEAGQLKANRMSFRTGLLSAAITAVSLGGGASAGREGPAVHLGATLAAKLARRLNLPPESGRILLAAGAAAAVSASFNVPLAAVLFAHEIILGHYALRAFVPTTLASVAATIITRVHLGDYPAFTLPDYGTISYWEMPAFALLGVVCAGVAISFMAISFFAEQMTRQLTLPLWSRPLLGGLAIGTLALVFPEVLGVGYEATDNALRQNYGFPLLIGLLAAKMIATAITLASRFGGGVFSPSLYLGAMAGGAFGLTLAPLSPDLVSAHGFYAIVGMGAVAAAVLGAPISTALIVFELIGKYEVILALLLANAIATALTQAIIGRSFFHWQLEQRGTFLQDGPHRRILLATRVRDIMEWYDTPRPAQEAPGNRPVLLPDDTLGKALALMRKSGTPVCPVTESDKGITVVGEVSEVRALRQFNDALIVATREEHR